MFAKDILVWRNCRGHSLQDKEETYY